MCEVSDVPTFQFGCYTIICKMPNNGIVIIISKDLIMLADTVFALNICHPLCTKISRLRPLELE